MQILRDQLALKEKPEAKSERRSLKELGSHFANMLFWKKKGVKCHEEK